MYIFFKIGRSFSFDDLITIPTLTRKITIRIKVFKSFWMTTDENFKIVKEIETENPKKELIKKEKEKIKTEAVTKARKEKKRLQLKEKQRKMLVKK